MINLTDRQRQALAYITRHTREHGYPPTLREIGDEMGIRSTHGVSDHLERLEAKGAIRRTPGAARGIRVLVEVPA